MKTSSFLKITAALIFVTYLYSCSKENISQQPPKNPLTVKAMKDSIAKIVAGLYSGKTPCADCDGINYTILLSSSMNFNSMSTYLGKDVVPFETKGTWRMIGDSIIAMEDTSSALSYLQIVNNDSLYMLDASMKRLTGPLASMFVLRKDEANPDTSEASGISDSNYVLEILNDRKISEKDYTNEVPNLSFETDKGTVSGSAGCNRMNAQIKISGNEISFFNLVLTRMMCPGDGESNLLTALKNTKTFKTENSKIYLIDGTKTLAVLGVKKDK